MTPSRPVFASYALLLPLALTLFGCGSAAVEDKPAAQNDPPHEAVFVNDHEVKQAFDKGVAALFEETPEPTPHATLVEQLKRTRCDLPMAPAGTVARPPEGVYRQRLGSVAVVGLIHECPSKKCQRNHSSLSSGVVIHSSGVVATNFHVVDAKRANPKGMAVMTTDRKVFFVDEVLAADKDNDVALLQLKDAHDLDAAPVYADEPVGKPVTIISHPKNMFYSLTQGVVSRYGIHRKRSILYVTADYARGSSGGPIFNDRGDVVGLVSSTASLAAQNTPLAIDGETKALTLADRQRKPARIEGKPMVLTMHHQMTVHTAVPARAILGLIGEDKATPGE